MVERSSALVRGDGSERSSGSGLLGEAGGRGRLGRVTSEGDYDGAGKWVSEVYVCWEFLEEMERRFNGGGVAWKCGKGGKWMGGCTRRGILEWVAQVAPLSVSLAGIRAHSDFRTSLDPP